MRRLLLALLPVLLAAVPAPAHAEDLSAWAFSIGSFEFHDQRLEALELGVEYRFDTFRLWDVLDLQPVIGVAGTEDENFWGYAGLRWDVPIFGPRIVPTIGFAAALYEKGDGKDLGGILEFRSSLDVAYQFDDGSRLGISLYHLSNARIYDRNPGSESLILTYSFRR